MTSSPRRLATLVVAAVLGGGVLAGCTSTSDGDDAGTTRSASPNDSPTASSSASPSASRIAERFDLEAHRGGLGLTTENTLEAFGAALALGVSTLELDTQVTEDGKVVVTHDRRVSEAKCADTSAVVAGDREFPYVGDLVKDLSLAQLRTVDCGHRRPDGHPGQRQVPGARIPELAEVFALVTSRGASDVRFNIELKVQADHPDETAPRSTFVRRVHEEVRAGGLADRVDIQSFDWASLQEMHRLDPRLPLVALVDAAHVELGRPGASPWLGGIDIDDMAGDAVRAAASVAGVATLSPRAVTGAAGPGFDVGPGPRLVTEAHERDLEVVPWTVDDPDAMTGLLDLGVDGLITNYPDRLRAVLATRGMPLPTAYPAR